MGLDIRCLVVDRSVEAELLDEERSLHLGPGAGETGISGGDDVADTGTGHRLAWFHRCQNRCEQLAVDAEAIDGLVHELTMIGIDRHKDVADQDAAVCKPGERNFLQSEVRQLRTPARSACEHPALICDGSLHHTSLSMGTTISAEASTLPWTGAEDAGQLLCRAQAPHMEHGRLRASGSPCALPMP